ncbi:MAG: urate hydroxylase PuuD [Alphaproteobacteria bacterium]|nr:urate hydroxylase PuuD [Alphaproteobacteria bacterium]
MAKFFGNLNLVMLVGLLAAIGVMFSYQDIEPVSINTVFHWLHVFIGILWIGLLYYLNFVQVPTMPAIPAELKKGVTGYIAPKVLFYFRWAALLTVVTGLVIAWNAGYVHRALVLQGATRAEDMIGLGMDLALIMAFNVWFIIWPAQKKILGIVEASDAEKAAAAPRALIASRLNTLLSLPMLYCMANANINV